MDTLGGILIKGLLSNNLIAGFFNLNWSITVEPVTPTPTPSVTVTPTPTIYPTPTPTLQPPVPNYGGGGGSVVIGRQTVPNNKDIKITIRYKDKQITSFHKKSDKVVKITINIIRMFNKISETIKKISVKRKASKQITVKVKKHDS